MKLYIFVLFVLCSINTISQTAITFFPQNQGHLWRYKMVPLDTLNNPIDSFVIFRVDSFATNANMYNKSAKVVLTKTGDDPFLYEIPYLDTILYSFEQNNAFEYLDMNQLDFLIEFLNQFLQDTTGGVFNFFKSFEGWHAYYRFANTVNQQYTILSRDTTFTIDTLTLPLRFQILGRRFNDQTIQTEIGHFTCKKFTIERRVSYLIPLPPPLPPLAVKIVGFLDSLWIAPQNWIVKTFSPSTVIDLTFLGLGSFTLPGMKMDIHNPPVSVEEKSDLVVSEYQLYQNYPNPFNPFTTIQYNIPFEGFVEIKVFDVLGREVKTLVNMHQSAGNYKVLFDAVSLPSGVYFYQINVNDYQATKKMILMR